jgi:hypothetical protein
MTSYHFYIFSLLIVNCSLVIECRGRARERFLGVQGEDAELFGGFFVEVHEASDGILT